MKANNTHFTDGSASWAENNETKYILEVYQDYANIAYLTQQELRNSNAYEIIGGLSEKKEIDP